MTVQPKKVPACGPAPASSEAPDLRPVEGADGPRVGYCIEQRTLRRLKSLVGSL